LEPFQAPEPRRDRLEGGLNRQANENPNRRVRFHEEAEPDPTDPTFEIPPRLEDDELSIVNDEWSDADERFSDIEPDVPPPRQPDFPEPATPAAGLRRSPRQT
jgi:hypothetical protein